MKRMPHLFSLAILAIAACDYETVAQFQPPQAPESVAIEASGSVVVSMALTGDIVRVDPHTGSFSTIATIPLGQCPPNPFPPIMGALALDDAGDIYVTANTCDPANRGIWKVDAVSGAASLNNSISPAVLANGISIVDDQIYFTDTLNPSGDFWTAPVSGGPASIFASSPLLAPTGDVFDPTPGQPGDEVPFPGANGVQRYLDGDDGHKQLVIANSGSGNLVLLDLEDKGFDVLVSNNIGCDDIAVDVKGNVLCTTDAFQTLLALSPDGDVKTVFDANDSHDPTPLDGPTAVTCKEGRRLCYISNAQFPFFPSTGNGPSIGEFKWVFKGFER